MPITAFDAILILLMLFSGVIAMIRGFSREVLSIASWVIAALAAVYFFPSVAPILKPYTDQISTNELVSQVAAGALIFFVTLIVVTFLTIRIADFIVDSRIGALDRSLGFVFGAARGALLVIVGLLFFNSLTDPENQPGWVANAKSKPLLESIGESIVQLLPDDLLDRIKEKEEGNSDQA